MNSHNLTRKRIEQENLDLIDTKRYKNKNVIFIFNKEFHEGIIGIIAAKLSQKFSKPCFVVTESQNLLKCSIRSQNNIKINKTINKLIENKLIISGGGHDEAGGFSAKKEYLSEIEEFINKNLRKLIKKIFLILILLQFFPKKIVQ